MASRDPRLFKETLHNEEENIYSVHLAIHLLLFTLAKTLGKYLKMEICNCIKSNSISASCIKLLTLHSSVCPPLHASSMRPRSLGQLLQFSFSKS